VCFAKPGFESKELQFAKHTLKDLIPPEQYEVINAISKIVLPEDKNNVEHSFIGLEHKAVASQLFGDKKKGKLGGASVWWKNQPHWCGEVQRQQRFRASQKDEAYYLILKCQYSDITWQWKNENVYPARFCEPLIEIRSDTVKVVEGHCFWFNLDAQNVYAALERDFGIELSEVGRRFGELRLADYSNGEAQVFNYHPNFGVYQEV
jgi:CRISPR-associated endonuclease/helicase Cas3